MGLPSQSTGADGTDGPGQAASASTKRTGKGLSRWRLLRTAFGVAGVASIARLAEPARPAAAQLPTPWTEDVPGNSVHLVNGGRNVGIGTSAPAGKLHVVEAQTNPRILVESTVNSSQPELNLQGRDSNGVTKNAGLSHLAGQWLGFWMGDSGGGSTKMAVTPAGRVGIGTTNPSGTLHLNSGELWIGAQKIADGGGCFYAP
jgi:hypothetical protein